MTCFRPLAGFGLHPHVMVYNPRNFKMFPSPRGVWVATKFVEGLMACNMFPSPYGARFCDDYYGVLFAAHLSSPHGVWRLFP